MSNEYRYAPLETPSTIRVIKIQEQKVNNEVACVICHVDQTEFDYEALSYVWGDSTPTRHVYLGNEADQTCLFPLHENLWRFLNWAWDRRMFNSWIWTDRACLNQHDGKEMAQQIPRMGEIFNNAEHVISWLDMSEREGRHLVCLQYFSLAEFDEKLEKELGGGSAIRHRVSQETELVAYAVLRHEYWNRLWITQEVVNAKRLTVMIGDHGMDMADVETMTSLFESNADFEAFLQLWPLYSRRGQDQFNNLRNMLDLVVSAELKCKLPQDRAYGILGLVADNSDGSSVGDYIQVDYIGASHHPGMRLLSYDVQHF
ncbi:heterokaryon incompatibility protein-domain-containing protein [Phyllosticta citribraziliensis]|uniref:Heterokaryon incompatibility protein-domain-containing protein n=1 Tax=Phyllosticta citribraziliensis TaxID=989973 RepID=A0ABR1LZH8_9PEZI